MKLMARHYCRYAAVGVMCKWSGDRCRVVGSARRPCRLHNICWACLPFDSPRCAALCFHGKGACASRHSTGASACGGAYAHDLHDFATLAPSTSQRALQVHWLRLLLDEGHTLGALAATNKMTCAVNLRAERRWIMTGTPTPGGVASEVRHLLPLLQILRHQPYGTNEALWRVRSV